MGNGLYGEQLLDLAERGEQGWSWDTLSMPNERHLLGFAHGVSGIACALAALAQAAGRPDFLAGAREALRYERAHLRAAEGNWPDLRSFSQPAQGGEPPCMVAWCHGAPGIGMARLDLHRRLPEEPEILAEAGIAIRTTAGTLAPASAQSLGNFSLCHGEGGNADLLILAADLLDLGSARIAEPSRGRGCSRHRAIRGTRIALALRSPRRRRNAQPDARSCRHRLFPAAALRLERHPHGVAARFTPQRTLPY